VYALLSFWLAALYVIFLALIALPIAIAYTLAARLPLTPSIENNIYKPDIVYISLIYKPDID
jgi:hypothetical protein